MFDSNSPEFTRASGPLTQEESAMQVFVSRHRPFFVLVAVLVVQLLLLSFQITRNNNVRLIRVWAVAVFDPLDRSLRGLLDATTKAWETYRDLWRADQENQELHVQLVTARSQIHQLSEQAAESQRLRTLLDFKNQLPFQTVAAEVIATSPGENSNAVFIGKGTDAGLTSDSAVITPTGVVGKIIAVFPHSSHVLLLTDPTSGTGVTLAQSRIQGVLKGRDQNQCQLQYVMNEESVAPGELVLTSGLDQIYPKGLPVGTVVQVSAGNIYKNILVKPAVDLNRLETVLVVLKPASGQQQALNWFHHP
jgi:rod shape-determining protein MreC